MKLNEIVNVCLGLMLFCACLWLSYLVYDFFKSVGYNMFYEDMVQDTLHNTLPSYVKPSCLIVGGKS